MASLTAEQFKEMMSLVASSPDSIRAMKMYMAGYDDNGQYIPPEQRGTAQQKLEKQTQIEALRRRGVSENAAKAAIAITLQKYDGMGQLVPAYPKK